MGAAPGTGANTSLRWSELHSPVKREAEESMSEQLRLKVCGDLAARYGGFHAPK